MAVKQIEGYSIFMGKVLGKGSYGSVYLGRQQSTGQQVAIKILSKDSIDKDQYLKAALKNQIEILQRLHSDNIVAFYDVMQSSKNYYIIQQLCDGDLAKHIKMCREQRPQEEAIQMLKQICNGFLTLVKDGIIHRDLKPANVMLKGKNMKIGDFGFARQVGNKSMVLSCVGTPLYMPLQVLKGQEYTSKCDIWALGVIFYEYLHGQTPWYAMTEQQLIKTIQKHPLQITRNDLSPETQDFLRRCLQLKQANRISWDQIFAHPIFKGYFLSRNDNAEFQNRMKMIMNKLRFYITQKNLDMRKVMESLGFGLGKQEITFQDFYHFFKRVYPQITSEQTDYVFKKTDTDHSGTISIEQLKQILLQNGIKLASQFDIVPSFEKHYDGRETFTRISIQTSNKIKNCFEKLYKIVNKNNLTLWKVFTQFDHQRGSLTLQEFTLLVRKVCDNYIQITVQEIKAGFDLIDEDSSNSIQFQQLDKYYSKINGVPQTITRKILHSNTITEGTLQFRPREEYKRRTRVDRMSDTQRRNNNGNEANNSNGKGNGNQRGQLSFQTQQYIRPPTYKSPQMNQPSGSNSNTASPNQPQSSPNINDPFSILSKYT